MAQKVKQGLGFKFKVSVLHGFKGLGFTVQGCVGSAVLGCRRPNPAAYIPCELMQPLGMQPLAAVRHC